MVLCRRPARIALALLLSLSACAAALDLEDGIGRDGGANWRLDGGLSWDGGEAPDAPCAVDDLALPEAPEGSEDELGGVAVVGDRVVLAYRRSRQASGYQAAQRLLVGELSETSQGAASLTVLSDAPLESLDASEVGDLSANAQGLLLTLTAATPLFAQIFALDPAGSASLQGALDGHRALAGARTADGALLLARSEPEEDLPEVTAARFSHDGTLVSAQALGTLLRPGDLWSLAWRADGQEEGCVCAATADEAEGALALFEASGSGAFAQNPLGIGFAFNLEAPRAFACRVALGEDYRAVAFEAGNLGARLLWASKEGGIRAGPIPFLAAGREPVQFDVASDGPRTALAFVDGPNPLARLEVRIFARPGEKAMELRADVGLDEYLPGRVRIAPSPRGFLVAFEAVRAAGRQIILRQVRCEP